jgi:RNA polymerase sigma-70 factor (ECF subfamily)
MSPHELEKLYDEHADALFAFLLQLTRHESDARDALQEIFSQIGRRPQSLSGVREPRRFLLKLAHNLAIDLFRRREARARAHEGLAAEPIEVFALTGEPDEAKFRADLASALAELPDDQRAVVHLKLWEELTFQDIAELLDIPANTAASRYRYGVDKLRDRLRPLYDEVRKAS